eukprot:TRINITY_DN4069_c0_g1_i1.p1 TRINITY_DN4069_c0_g1~~TRINITY_DN4069_c0_g1_i1.p1  ORF type:complete len:794 (+),score=128.36 TRINITY_DN4069_c0_g1_i1:3-2384(+)
MCNSFTLPTSLFKKRVIVDFYIMPGKRTAPEVAGTAINDLRVVDLRAALAKKGLPTNGNKADLVKRLSEAQDTAATSNKKKKPEPAPIVEKTTEPEPEASEMPQQPGASQEPEPEPEASKVHAGEPDAAEAAESAAAWYCELGWVDINPGHDHSAHRADSFEQAARISKEHGVPGFTWVVPDNMVYLKHAPTNVESSYGRLLCVSGMVENDWHKYKHLHRSWTANAAEPVAESTAQATAAPMVKPSGTDPVLAGVRCLLTGFGASHLRDRIERHGGTVMDAVRKTLPLTHLVVGESGVNEWGQKTGKGSKKYKEAMKLRPKPIVVDPQFIIDTLAKGVPVFPEVYAEVAASRAAEAATATPEDRLEALHRANTKKDVRAAADEVVAIIDRGELPDETLVLIIKTGLDYPQHRGSPMRKEAGNLIMAAIRRQLEKADEQQFRRLVPLWAKAALLLVEEDGDSKANDAVETAVRMVTYANVQLGVPLLLDAQISCDVVVLRSYSFKASTEVAQRILTELKDGPNRQHCIQIILQSCSLEPDVYRTLVEEVLQRLKENPAMFFERRYTIDHLLACNGLQAESAEAKDAIRAEIRAKFKECVESPKIRRFLVSTTEAKGNAYYSRKEDVFRTFPEDFFVKERREEAARAEAQAKLAAEYDARVNKLREALKEPEIKLVTHWAQPTRALAGLVNQIRHRSYGIYYPTSQYSVTVVEVGDKHYTIVMERFEDTSTGGVFVNDARGKPQDGKWFCEIGDGFNWRDTGNDLQDAYGSLLTRCLETWYHQQDDLPAGVGRDD